jgi:hypothetical protein
MDKLNTETGEHSGRSHCSDYLEWLETAAERETKKAVAKKQDGELVASTFAEGVAVGLRLAATEFEDGGISSANVRDHRCSPGASATTNGGNEP